MSVFDHIINDREQVLLDDVYLDQTGRDKLLQFIKEHTYIDELNRFGLPVNNKIMLHGSSGCGKTMTAKALANAGKKHSDTQPQ